MTCKAFQSILILVLGFDRGDESSSGAIGVTMEAKHGALIIFDSSHTMICCVRDLVQHEGLVCEEWTTIDEYTAGTRNDDGPDGWWIMRTKKALACDRQKEDAKMRGIG